MDVTGKSAKEIESLIVDQGNKVRSLKAAKADKSVISAEVEVLKFLKAMQTKANDDQTKGDVEK